MFWRQWHSRDVWSALSLAHVHLYHFFISTSLFQIWYKWLLKSAPNLSQASYTTCSYQQTMLKMGWQEKSQYRGYRGTECSQEDHRFVSGFKHCWMKNHDDAHCSQLSAITLTTVGQGRDTILPVVYANPNTRCYIYVLLCSVYIYSSVGCSCCCQYASCYAYWHCLSSLFKMQKACEHFLNKWSLLVDMLNLSVKLSPPFNTWEKSRVPHKKST